MPTEKVSAWSRFAEFFSDYVIFPFTNQNFTVIYLIDILLLAALLYMAYKFIRDRHAGKTLIGLCVLFLIYVASDVLGMVAIHSIFKNFFTVGILAVVVLFQGELRDVLDEFGATASSNFERIRNRHSNGDEQLLATVEEVSAAAFELSAKGEGALIVLERNNKLRNQMSEGTPIDAVVSRQLLCNIFVNKAPLHDGAVIIRNCRIVSASCKSKTISENDELAEGLGTRHRAALRISEISDAVVLVVSEETGTISIANNKLLRRHYNDVGQGGRHKSSDLRDDLFKLLSGKEVTEITAKPDADKPLPTVAEETQEHITIDDEVLHGLEETENGGAEN